MNELVTNKTVVSKVLRNSLSNDILTGLATFQRQHRNNPKLMSLGATVSLLALSACGGGSSSPAPAPATQISGDGFKGPLQNAFVFYDADDDGVFDYTDVNGNGVFDQGVDTDFEPFSITDADGAYELDLPAGYDASHPVILISQDDTRDTFLNIPYEGKMLSSTTSTVTSQITTLISSGVDEDDVYSILGLNKADLPADFSFADFNPFTLGADAPAALKTAANKTEEVSQQLKTVLQLVQSSATGAGVTADEAFASALKAVVTKLQTGDASILTDEAALADVVQVVADDIATSNPAAAAKIAATKSAVAASAKLINDDFANLDLDTIDVDAIAKSSSSVDAVSSSLKTKVETTDAAALEAELENFDDEVIAAKQNSAPTDIVLSQDGSAVTGAVNVAEGSLVVGVLSTTDADANDTHSYSLSGADAAKFEIVNGELRFKEAVDYETATQKEFNVTVRSTDNGGKFVSESFVINVTDVVEAVSLSNTSVDENTTAVGSLSTSGVGAGATVTYSLGGADASAFEIDGDVILFKTAPDYETKSSYEVEVTSTDGGSLTATETFTVTINDVNEAPTAVALSSTSVDENITAVGTLSTTDEDAGDSHTYEIGGTDAASFEISGNELSFKTAPDFETKSSYSITITSTDAGGLSSNAEAFTISINDVGTAFLESSLTNTITARTDGLSISGNVVASDTSDASLTYSITSGVGTLGTLSLNADGSYSYVLNANSGAMAGGQDVFAVTVTDGTTPQTENLVITVEATTAAANEVLLLSSDSGAVQTSITAASDAAVAGDMILVGSGSYDEDVTIDVGVTLLGANHGLSAVQYDADGHPIPLFDGDKRTSEAAAETHINGTLTVASSDVVVDGFVLHHADGPLTFAQVEGLDNITLTNNYITGYLAGNAPSYFAGYEGTTSKATGWDISNNFIGGVVTTADNYGSGSLYLGGLNRRLFRIMLSGVQLQHIFTSIRVQTLPLMETISIMAYMPQGLTSMATLLNSTAAPVMGMVVKMVQVMAMDWAMATELVMAMAMAMAMAMVVLPMIITVVTIGWN